MKSRSIGLSLVAFFGMGCATGDPALYHWMGYEHDLYTYYTDPGHAAAFEARLAQLIELSNSTGVKVAPGLYAEYGFALYKRGKTEEALANFELERATWPESQVLVDRLIERIEENRKTKNESPAAPEPPALE